MIKVKVSTNFPDEPIERQIPVELTSNIEFRCDDRTTACNTWVVLSDLDHPERTLVDHGPIVLVTMEPKEYCRYDVLFLRQFDFVVSSFKLPHSRCIISTEICPPWHAGLRKETGSSEREPIDGSKIFRELRDLTPPKKTKTISAIVSMNQKIPGHAARKTFLNCLKSELGDELDLFGLGTNPVSDKLDGILPYRYHLALENSAAPNYWSEKLPDALIGYSYPFYYGSSAVDQLFPGPFCCRIDVNDVPKSIQLVKDKVSAGLTVEERNSQKIARDLIFARRHLFGFLTQQIESLNTYPYERIRRRKWLFPNRFFLNHNLKSRFKMMLIRAKCDLIGSNAQTRNATPNPTSR